MPGTAFRLSPKWPLLSVLAAVGLAACGTVLDPYEGPRPAQEGIASEVVIVRSVATSTSGQRSFIMDRVRYLEGGDPHNVNRVVWVFATSATLPQVTAVDPQPGDRLVISTQYSSTRKVGELEEVPNWPGHKFIEYPIGAHQLTSIARP